jgi:type II secretory pathway pseudopilin PulG
MALNQEKGFTLVEAIVAAAVSVIIGVVMVSVIYMTGTQVSDTTRNVKILMQYDVAIAQIGRDAQRASAVLDQAEAYPPWNNANLTTQTIFMYGITGNIIAGYRINGTTLQSWNTATNAWVDFRIIPSDPAVQVTNASNFALLSNRITLTLNLNLVFNYKGKQETFNSGQELFLCRNVKP